MSVADSVPAPWTSASLAEAVAAVGAEDLFVLRRVGGDRFAHLGGVGRGAGWAGIVEISEQELLDPESRTDSVVHWVSTNPSHIFGPYYARAAAIVRVSHDVVVIFGGSKRVEGSDDELIELGRFVSGGLVEVAPAKRLADELEVLTALQAFLHAPPDTLAETLDRLAEHAARALSCEVAIAYLADGEQLAVCDLRGGEPFVESQLRELAAGLASRDDFPKCVQETRVDDLPSPVSAADGVVAYYLLEIKHPDHGFLLLLHTTASPLRGFTLLCQSLGGKLVEAAEPLLEASAMRDRMRSELVRAQADARCDRLTGLANRLAWDEAIAAATPAEGPSCVVMIDGCGLKTINDTYGHDVGDEALRAIADVLNGCVRDGDVVARLGGDEFGLLLRDADDALAGDVVGRVERSIQATRLSSGAEICISLGTASTREADLATAQRLADSRMLDAKRERRERAAQSSS